MRGLAVHRAPHGIRVNANSPAYFSSDMTGPIVDSPTVVRTIEERTPVSRLGRPEELSGPVVCLASEASSSVTGQTLYVDGAW